MAKYRDVVFKKDIDELKNLKVDKEQDKIKEAFTKGFESCKGYNGFMGTNKWFRDGGY